MSLASPILNEAKDLTAVMLEMIGPDQLTWTRSFQSKPGASIPPEAMTQFPLFQIPPISENIFGFREIFFQFYLFQKIFLDFPPKFLMTFF